MATSKCPKCESARFELKIGEPKDSRFKVNYIQCASCGTVIGVTDYYNTSTLLEKIGKKIGIDIFK